MANKKDTDRKKAFNRAHYDRIEVTIPKGQRKTVQAAAGAKNESVNAYVNKAILQRMGLQKWPDNGDHEE